MLKVKTIDHVAIAVPDLAPTAAALGPAVRARGREPGRTWPTRRPTCSSCSTDQASRRRRGASLELICPNGNASLERFLSKRGPGLHHVCFEVDDLPAPWPSSRPRACR